MSIVILTDKPRLSWDRGSLTASQTICQAAGGHTATLTLNKASLEAVTVDIVARGDALMGVDYKPTARTVTFAPGETTKTIGVSMLQHSLFRKTKYVDLIAVPRAGKAIKGDYVTWRFHLHGLVDPPTVTYSNAIAATAGLTDVFTIVVELSAKSRETTYVPFDASEGTLSLGVGFTPTGAHWSASEGRLEIPAGVTVSRLDITFLGIAGSFRSRIDVPADNVRRNLMCYTGLGEPEGGILSGTEGQYDTAIQTQDDADYYHGFPTDSFFGCDNPYAIQGYWSLIHNRSSTIDAPDGSHANYFAVNDEGSGSTLFGCIRRSYNMGLVGGWDYSGAGGTNNVPLKEGYNIWSVHLRNDGAEATFTQAEYSAVTLYNRSVALGSSEDPNPAAHTIQIQWTAGVPAISGTDGVVTLSGVIDEGGGWYRLWLIYNAPAAAEGDVLNWFVTPVWHPTEATSLHLRAGCYAWGVQFEYDLTRTATAPTDFQAVEEMTWYAATATAGAEVLTVVTVS